MASYLLLAHSHWRYLVLLLVTIAALRVVVGWLGKQKWQKFDDPLLTATVMSVVLQFLLGLVLYIMTAAWNIQGYTTGHVLPGFLGTVAVSMGHARAKRRTTDPEKFKIATIGLASGLLFISVAVWYATR